MLGVTVQGGTGAGTRIVRKPESWACECDNNSSQYLAVDARWTAQRRQPGDRYSCPDCGARRP